MLYGAPSSSIQILQRAQNNAARIVLQSPRRSHVRPLLRELHWLPIQHGIEYKVAVFTFKSRSSATAPTYLTRHIKARVSERILRSSTAPLLDKPFTRTDFANWAFRCSAPTVWNSLPETIMPLTNCVYFCRGCLTTVSPKDTGNSILFLSQFATGHFTHLLDLLLNYSGLFMCCPLVVDCLTDWKSWNVWSKVISTKPPPLSLELWGVGVWDRYLKGASVSVVVLAKWLLWGTCVVTRSSGLRYRRCTKCSCYASRQLRSRMV